MTAALIFGLPEAPTVLFLVALAMVMGYGLLRAYTRTQQVEIDDLRAALDKQSERHARDMAAVNTKVDRLEVLYDEQRSMKHKAFNDVAKTVMALDLVQRLAQECSCKVLSPLDEIIARLVADLETYTPPTVKET